MRIFAAWIAIVGLLPPVLRMALKGTITAEGAAICLLGAVVLLAFERRFRTGVLAVGGVRRVCLAPYPARYGCFLAQLREVLALSFALFGIYIILRGTRASRER